MKDSTRAGFMDHFALWASLGASLYLMPFGALLVPALSIEQAVLATLLAGLVGGLVIASVAWVAAHTGQSTAELLTELLGNSMRVPISVLLLLRHVLFAVFAIVLMADAAELISKGSLGAGLRPLWVVILALATLGLILAGERRVLSVLKRAGIWLVLLVAIAISASAYMEFAIPSYLKRPPSEGWPSFWQAVDIMLIFPLLWLPVVADFAARGADSRSAARGSFAGILLTTVWFGVLGILYLPATDSGDIPGFLVGMQLGIGALVILFLLQVDEVYVSTYSSIKVLQSLRPGVRTAVLPAGLLGAVVPLAVLLNVSDLEAYVILAAALFVPAFGVLIAQALLPQPGRGFVPVVAWAGGFITYQWITPADIGWWRDAFSTPFGALGLPFALSDDVTWLGAAIPSLIVAGGISIVVPPLLRLFSASPRAAEPAG